MSSPLVFRCRRCGAMNRIALLAPGREPVCGRLVVLKVDTEADQAAAARFGVQAIPTLAAFRAGREVDRVSGALPLEALRRFAAAAAVGV
jgi:thioredoxin 2